MKGKISILAPISTAILGYKSGDTIQWEYPRVCEDLESTTSSISPKLPETRSSSLFRKTP